MSITDDNMQKLRLPRTKIFG